jgi:hypothetical protein
MPKIYLSNPGTYETVTRPVILEITRNILELTGLPKDMQILYAGDTQKALQTGSTIRGEADGIGANNFATNDKITVDVEEIDDPDRTFSIAVAQSEHRPIFLDERVETLIKPVYSPQDVTITIRYRAVDKTSAMRWRDEMRSKVARFDDQQLHRVKYSYLLPEEFIVILKEINRLMTAVAPYSPADPFDVWFRKYASQRVNEVTTLAGTAPKKAVSETQMRIVGFFEFETAPEKGEVASDNSSWIINCTYRFKYEKPVGCEMIYPLMIHNQLIVHRPDAPQEMPEAHLRSYSKSAAAMRYFELGARLLGMQNGVAIPSFDEFFPKSTPQSTVRIFTALTSLTTDPPPADNRKLLDLVNLGGDVVLHPRILRFLRGGEWSFLTRLFLSVFNVALYENRYMLDSRKAAVNSALDVSSTVDLDLRNYHHVRFAFVEDFSLLSQAAQERLRNNADIVMLVLKQMALEEFYPAIVGCNLSRVDIDEALALDSDDPADFCTNYISREEWNNLIAKMNRVNMTNEHVRQFNTVMTLTIQSHKESELNADR